jgi:hypothetical protein
LLLMVVGAKGLSFLIVDKYSAGVVSIVDR